MILKELSEAIGVSGKEDAVRKLILNAIKDHAGDIRIDPLGSVTALKRGTGSSPLRVMVAAHMDEVGFIVRGFDSDGLIRFSAVGGIDDRILPGLRVKVGDNALPGVILWTPIHQIAHPPSSRSARCGSTSARGTKTRLTARSKWGIGSRSTAATSKSGAGAARQIV